jgi:hypothetical protein
MAREDARHPHQQVDSDQESSDRQGQDLESFSSSGIRSDQPAFRGDGNSFGPTNCFQLCQDRSDVTLYRRFADIKDRPDLLIASSIGDGH